MTQPTFNITVETVENVYGASVEHTGPVFNVIATLDRGVPGPPGGAMSWRGAWSAASTYAVLDAVSHGGSSYVCTAAVGPTATTPDADTAHWSVLAVAGADGAGTVNGPASAVDGNLAVWDGTTGALVKDGGAVPTLAGLGAVPTARTITAGSGLTGGGDLTADRAVAADFGTASGKVAQGNDSRFVGVPETTFSADTTLDASHAGQMLRGTSASARTLTINNSIFSAGQIIEVMQYGAGQVTVAAGSGVTLRTAGAGLKTRAQYSCLSIYFVSASEAVVTGDAAA